VGVAGRRALRPLDMLHRFANGTTAIPDSVCIQGMAVYANRGIWPRV